jgi:riboflavin kinase / FMN adenylyltransferase
VKVSQSENPFDDRVKGPRNPAVIVCEDMSDVVHAVADHETALTIGVFDGLHLGHQALIKETFAQARAHGLKTAVMTFRDHPLRVLAPPFCPKRLLYSDRKRRLLDDMGVDVLLDLAFSREFSETGPDKFIADVLSGVFHCRVFICGDDFTFGKDGGGNVALLRDAGKRTGFDVHVVEAVAQHDVLVKSTQIRDLILSGLVEHAATLLTRPYELRGTVVHGHHRGRTIGFPTANIPPDPTHIVPARGVYLCGARVHDFEHPVSAAMVNIGHAPTFGMERLMVEAHLLDFEGDLAGKELEIHFYKRLRDEVKFAGVDALVAQLEHDRSESHRLLQTPEIQQLMKAS